MIANHEYWLERKAGMTEQAAKIERVQVDDTRPSIETEKLWLRPFQMVDAPAMHQLVNEKEIAANTRSIQFPYPDGAAEQWIEKHPELWLTGKSAVFAIWHKTAGEHSGENNAGSLVGAIGLEIDPEHQHAELGYWVGKAFWNQGICTEAARAVVAFGFEKLALNRIHAHFMTRNPASGRIMEKIGMKREGLLRKHVRKWGVFEDIEFFGILKSDFDSSKH